MFQGWLWLVNGDGLAQEVFNHARTSFYLQNSESPGCNSVSNVLDDGGCAAYRFAPPNATLRVLGTDLGEMLINDQDEGLETSEGPITSDGWGYREYVSQEADEAPWYNPLYPESAEGIGFWVEEWTGLDSQHIQRAATPVGAYRGGGQLGLKSNLYREMAFQVLLLGESEQALEYMFRWLEKAVSGGFGACQLSTMVVRRYCPDLDDDPDAVSDGVVQIRDVGLASGLQWEGQIFERGQCFMRRVSFRMIAEDPCMYSVKTGLPVTAAEDLAACFAAASLSQGNSPCRPDCSSWTLACRRVYTFDVDTLGPLLPSVVLKTRSTSSRRTLPMRIRLYFDRNNDGVGQLCNMELKAELNVITLPNDSTMLYDMATRQVLYEDSSTNGLITGFPYLEPNTIGVPRFSTLCEGTYHLVVEPNTTCLNFSSGTTWVDSSGRQFRLDSAFPDVEVFIQERLGCA